MLTNLTPELLALSTLIGSGRHTAGVSVALMEVDGEGVYLPLHYGGQECGLWLSQSCWQHWLDTTLATDNPRLLTAELVIAMANWAVTPLLAPFADLVALAEPPQKRSLPMQWAVTVAFELEEQQITGVLLDWPQAALADTLSHWPREAVIAPDFSWQSGLVAGWCRLSLRQLRQLGPGDGLRLSMAAELDEEACWLWHYASPQIYIKLEDGNKMTVQQINEDSDPLVCGNTAESPPLVAVQLEDLPQTLVMEIGRLTLPLSDIKQLAVGQTLACQTHCYGEVNIRLHGQSVGRGSLLRCDEQLVVRIAQWGLQNDEKVME
ncbi:YscQ/HrcQ family type III secretion apparatus protein [Yersinia similis]|uniref:Type III secretion system protein SsaQ n=1 Tax=Yersinia similis TaxID=367190 RepID=A0A0T9R3I6_9GAMM|nr:YscQ/HrcQ family type III secretion apparatus protein [Yersinia similis]CNG26038.1 type III secretion system protein SsaQ [Yersinia similis]CNI42822.1 type III secretion system protein SsaQ [Yersinia similis]